MKNFNFKSYIVGGDCDIFTNIQDFEYYLSLVKKENKTFLYLKDYNHLDYLWGKDANEDIYLDVIKFIKK